MKPLSGIFVSALGLVLFAGEVRAQELLVPAGTLLQCTLDEPNFSSATASMGDPVLCHLRTLTEFDRPAFPRGTMLGGHLEEAKNPGHLWGKGYLKITFDHVILPYGDLPVPAKVIHAKGFKVDKKGDIEGKGHATRDVVEWMFPPMWPWKVVSLPLRGPRPTLKGEEPLELRLMDDIMIPSTLAYGPLKPDRPPYGSSARPSALSSRRGTSDESVVQKRAFSVEKAPVPAAGGETRPRLTILALKSGEIFEVDRYQIYGNMLTFQELDGTKGGVDLNRVDWRKTSEMSSEARSVDQRQMAGQMD